MRTQFSDFGARFLTPSGTRQLMDDLGELQRASDQVLNLGGGNPSRIPEIHEWFAAKILALATDRSLDNVLAAYDDPRGNHAFLNAASRFFSAYFRRPISPSNVVCTAGSQASFFMLFNLFAGRDRVGRKRKILLPQSPEYIGYSGLCIEADTLTAVESRITFTAPHRIKYEIDFDALEIDDEVGAICLSRPTNPTGNVVSDADIERLGRLAAVRGIPLIIDCAYGEPFPGISFAPNHLMWSDHMILCFSLSKLGLPGVRTGIVLAASEVVEALVGMNATMTLSSNSLGAHLSRDLFESKAILDFASNVICPYYRARSQQAMAYCDEFFSGLDYFVHESEGAIFLWVWFRNLPISAQCLYGRLKARGVLVIPGHHFTPGTTASAHANECIRISYAQSDDAVRRGIASIADEVKDAFAGR